MNRLWVLSHQNKLRSFESKMEKGLAGTPVLVDKKLDQHFEIPVPVNKNRNCDLEIPVPVDKKQNEALNILFRYLKTPIWSVAYTVQCTFQTPIQSLHTSQVGSL